MSKDPIDLGFESHIEHPVGFIQHKNLYLLQCHRPLFQVIVESAGSRNKNTGIVLQCFALQIHRRATHKHRHTNP